jgi:hypothetical protein
LLLLDFLLFGMLKIKMKKVKILLVVFLIINFSFFVNAKDVPESFALTKNEKLIIKNTTSNILTFFILIFNIPNNKKSNNSKN